MRLDDINAFVDAKRVYDRAYRRAFGDHATDIQLSSINEFREAATLTDSSIRRLPVGPNAILRLEYRGVEFWYMAASEEVE